MLRLFRLFFFSSVALVAEILFLRKQLALFQERKAKPQRTTRTFRLAMVALARFFDWRGALVIVKPATFLKWHRNAFRQFWRWKSRKRGRPASPSERREIIRKFARENPTWGEEGIADELLVKFGIPEPIQANVPDAVHRHMLPVGYRITSKSILGGLHHDYRLGKEAA